MKLSDFKIAKKLYSLIAIALFGMIGLSAINQYQAEKIYNSANYATTNTVPSILLMSDALVKFNEIRVQIRNQILDTDLNKKAVIEKKMQKQAEFIAKSLTIYDETMISDTEDKRLLDIDRVLLEKFINSLEPVMALSRQNKNQEAFDSLTTNALPIANEFDNALNNHMDYNKKLAVEGVQTALAVKNFANGTSIVTTAMTLLLVSFLSWLIANKGLARPIDKMVNALKQLASGKLNIEVTGTDRKDEIGDIARALEILLGVSKNMEAQRIMKQSLADIDQALLNASTYAEFANALASEVVPILRMVYSALYILDDKKQTLNRVGGYGCDDSVHTTHFSLGQGLIGQCGRDAQTIAVSISADSVVGVTVGVGVVPIRHLMVLPVVHDDKVLGVFEVGSIDEIDAHKIALLDNLMPVVAAKIQILSGNVATTVLLQETLEQSESMTKQAAQLEEQSVEMEMQQRELKETETWFQSVIQAAPNAMLIVNKKDEIILCNPKAEELFGYEKGELQWKKVAQLLPLSSLDPMQKIINVQAKHKDKNTFPIEISLSNLPDSGGRGECVYASVRPI